MHNFYLCCTAFANKKRLTHTLFPPRLSPSAVPSAASSLPVHAPGLQTPARQTQQRFGRLDHVLGSGKIPLHDSLSLCSRGADAELMWPDVVVFAQVGHCYLTELSSFPKELTELLLNHHTVLEPDLRMVRSLSLSLSHTHTRTQGLATLGRMSCVSNLLHHPHPLFPFRRSAKP